MKVVSRKEQIISKVEFFIFCQNEKLRRYNNFTFDFELFEEYTEIENRICIPFKSMNDAIDIISSFNQHDYKKNIINKSYLENKLIGCILDNVNVHAESNFYLSFFLANI